VLLPLPTLSLFETTKDKKYMSRILFLILLFPFISPGQTRYSISKPASHFIWECDYVLGKGHKGTLDILSGTITTDGTEKLVKGDFVLDMNSITTTDDKKEKEQKNYLLEMNTIGSTGDVKKNRARNDLEKHLMSADFFDTPKFPTSTFSITKVEPVTGKVNEYIITGYLSMKGITNAIQFPATITLSNGFVQAKAEVTIDRTKWDIIYKSGSIFPNLKDSVISDEIKLSLDLLFSKG
jgi:polyisoprenoid-binding protein YceI